MQYHDEHQHVQRRVHVGREDTVNAFISSHLSRIATIRNADILLATARSQWHTICTAKAVRKTQLFAFLLVSTFGLCHLFAEDAGARQRFAGTWEGKLKDKVICTIKLDADEAISGAMHACQINVNGDGDLIESEESQGSEEKPDPILDPKIQGDTLSFAIKDEDSEPPLKFELKLSGEQQAELTILNAPGRVKPIHFAKK